MTLLLSTRCIAQSNGYPPIRYFDKPLQTPRASRPCQAWPRATGSLNVFRNVRPLE